MISFTEKGAEKVKEFLGVPERRRRRPPACGWASAAAAAPASSTRSRSTRSATATRCSRTTACASSSTVRACRTSAARSSTTSRPAGRRLQGREPQRGRRVRLRLLLPRRGRGRGLRGLAVRRAGSPRRLTVSRALVVAAAALGLALAACGDSDTHGAQEDPFASGAVKRPRRRSGDLAVGSPSRTRTSSGRRAPSRCRPSSRAGRRSWSKMRPGVLPHPARLAVAAAAAGHPPNFEIPPTGCLRGTPPCASFGGLREQLRGARRAPEARRLAGADGDRRHAGVGGASRVRLRAPADAAALARAEAPALAAYERSSSEVIELGGEVGVKLRYWSPWNEPNHPFCISPQRARCTPTSPARRGQALRGAGGRDAQARARQGARRPGMVLGELAGLQSQQDHEQPRCRSSSASCQDLVVLRLDGRGPSTATSAASTRSTTREARWPRPTLPAEARDVDDRDRRRRAARRPGKRLGARAPSARDLPRRCTAARPVVRGPAGDRGVPVHVPRGRHVPRRARHDRARGRVPGAQGVAGMGRGQAATAGRPAATGVLRAGGAARRPGISCPPARAATARAW